MYQVYFSKKALKDKKLLKQAGREKKRKDFSTSFPKNHTRLLSLTRNSQDIFRKCILEGLITHRFIYKVEDDAFIVSNMWPHYGI